MANEGISNIICGASIKDLIPLLRGEEEVFVVCDRNVESYAAAIAEAARGAAAAGARMLAIDTSERLKSMESAMDIAAWLLEQGASRKALAVAVGGGITTDLVGFAASIYKRGVRYANVPTTLLAQVDAAIGGKTGVNFLQYKNMLGVIVQPQFTFISPEPLKTLPEREFKAGLAEMLKTFIIADENAYGDAVRFFADAQKYTSSPGIEKYIRRAAEIKAAIVERDPYEKGERAVLNLGHTFAHAIEHEAARRGDDVLHGEAVAIGIIMAAEMAEAKGIGQKGLAARLKADFATVGLPVECPYDGLEPAMLKDKKAAADRVTFILPAKIGEVVKYDLHVDTK